MAKLLSTGGTITKIRDKLTAEALRFFCGEGSQQLTLLSGDILIAGVDPAETPNKFASFLSKQSIKGDAILCETWELD